MTESDLWPLFQDLRFAAPRALAGGGACFVAEGRILVEDLLAWGRAGRVEVVAVLAEAGQGEAIRPRLPAATALLEASRAELEVLTGFAFHRGLLAAARVPEAPGAERLRAAGRLLVLPAVGDPENLGQLLRTAAALGLNGALLGPGPDPFSRRVVRVSMGTAWKLPLWRSPDVWGELAGWRDLGGEVVAAALGPEALPVSAWGPAARTALVLGPEGPGLSGEDLARCDRRVRIPMAPGVDSLNVAAAGAILMHRMVA